MDHNERLIKTKEAWAKRKRGGEEREVFETDPSNRLPPGQHLRAGWPVLDLGYHPEIAPADWTLTVNGFVATPLQWTWQDLLAQPQITVVSDFHCVTSWILGNAWVLEYGPAVGERPLRVTDTNTASPHLHGSMPS